MTESRYLNTMIIVITAIAIVSLFIRQVNCNPLHGATAAGNLFTSRDQYFIESNAEYPFMAQLDRKTTGKFLCGGTIIKPQFILTAAHCVFDTVPERLRVRAGTYLVSDTTSKFVQIRNVDEFKYPPEFLMNRNKPNLDYDIAVIKVNNPFNTDTKYVNVIKMPTRKHIGKFTRKTVKLLGFGETENKKRSSYLQHANVKVISKVQCMEMGSGHFTFLICTLGVDQNVALKYGDSGGAIVQHFKGKPHKSVLIGVTTFMIGNPNGRFNPKLPSVFVEIGHFRIWIEKTISEM